MGNSLGIDSKQNLENNIKNIDKHIILFKKSSFQPASNQSFSKTNKDNQK